MNQQIAAKVAKQYFDRHQVNELYLTYDEQAFFHKHDAESHAASFKSKELKEVFTVTRAEAEAAENDDGSAEKKALDEKNAAEKQARQREKNEKAKAEKVQKMEVRLSDLNIKKAEAESALANETNEDKKVKISTSLGGINAKIEELENELQALQAE